MNSFSPDQILFEDNKSKMLFGHIDGKAKLTKNDIKNRSEEWTVKPPKKLMKYISEKGSISIKFIDTPKDQ